MSDHQVDVAGTMLAFRRRGARGAPALLLLHGVTDGAATWERVVRELEADADVVIPDARGHGRSSRSPTPVDVPRLAADAAAIVDHAGLSHVAVWGHSMGAATAAHLAAARPDLVRVLVLEDPPFGMEEPRQEGVVDPHWEAFMEVLAGMRAMTPGARLAVAQRDNPAWDALEQSGWALTKAQFDPDFKVSPGMGARWRDVVARITAPTLLVTGDAAHGAVVTEAVASEFARLVPDAAVLHVEGAGHSVHRDRFDAVLTGVQDFLARHATP